MATGTVFAEVTRTDGKTKPGMSVDLSKDGRHMDVVVDLDQLRITIPLPIDEAMKLHSVMTGIIGRMKL